MREMMTTTETVTLVLKFVTVDEKLLQFFLSHKKETFAMNQAKKILGRKILTMLYFYLHVPFISTIVHHTCVFCPFCVQKNGIGSVFGSVRFGWVGRCSSWSPNSDCSRC